MSTEFKRNFARRHITWKIRNLSKENVDKCNANGLICSSDFDILLHDNETKWKLKLCPSKGDEEKKSLGVFLYLMDYNSNNFTTTLTVINGARVESSFIRKSQDLPEKRWGRGWPALFSHDDLFAETQTFIVDDVLTLEFELELLEDSKFPPFLDSKLARNNLKMLGKKKYSDLVLIGSNGKKIHAAKNVISFQCPAFAVPVIAVINETNSVKFDDMDSKTILNLLRFIYTGQHKNFGEVDLQLLIVANRFGIDDLREMCISSLMETFPRKGFMKVLNIADKLEIQDLKDNIIDFIKCKRNRLTCSDLISFSLMQEILSSILKEPNRLVFENDANKHPKKA